MEGDKFESTYKPVNMFAEENSNNFFLRSDGNFTQMPFSEPQRHLNDYDAKILEEKAYREVPDEILKLEYKISRAENEIKELDKQIQMADEINNTLEAQSLRIKKLQWTGELKQLTEKYENLSISAKITGSLTSKIKGKILNLKNTLSSLTGTLLSKLPGKWSSIAEVRNSLNTLENINKNVDELMAIQYPYGEAADKYDQLSRYLARANEIQTQISKFMGTKG